MQLLFPLLAPLLAPTAVTVALAAIALPLTTADVTAASGTPNNVTTASGTSTNVTTAPRPLQTVRSSAPSDPGASAHAAPPPARRTRGLTAGWPLSPPPAIHRRFEQPRNQWSGGHRGVDLIAAVGQPVLSAGDGVVAFTGVVAGRGVITVRHSGGLRTTYEPVDQRLAAGTLVRRGATIGLVSAAAGHCAPLTCVHWGAISGHAYRDPLSLLGLVQLILLPLG